MRPYVQDADAYVFSRERFVWDGLDRDRVWIVPPSIDAFSPKNQDLDPEAVQAILAVIGLGAGDDVSHALFKRFDGSEARVGRHADLVQDGPVPEDSPLISQISRWDRLKDPVGMLRCFAEYAEADGAHLLLAGPSVAGVSDDPEGAEVLAEVNARREELPAEKRGAGASRVAADGRRRGERRDGERDPAALRRGRAEEPRGGLRAHGRRGDVEGEAGGREPGGRDPGSDRGRRLRGPDRRSHRPGGRRPRGRRLHLRPGAGRRGRDGGAPARDR